MISHSESRLAVTVVILMLQSLIFMLELLIFTKRVRRTSWYRPVRQFVGPVLMASLVTILIPITLDNASSYMEGGAEHCSSSVDGDIAGQGAQIAVWAQVGVLLIIAVLGSFHTSATGAKEVGAGLVLTHVSLSIAILAQMRLGTLSSADAIIGAMILDAQNAGLSIQLAAKETLAARWQIKIVVLAQIFGLITIPVLVSNFIRGEFASDDCRCLTVFWWAWLSSCGSATVREMLVFWIYYSCRCVGIFQNCFHSLYNTSKFDKAEKSERPLSDSWREGPDVEHIGGRDIRLRRVTHLYRRQNGQVVCFREYPATVTLMYTVYGAFSLISMGTAQTSVASLNLKPPSPIDSVGQIISLVVAAATIGRAAWLFFMLFRHEAQRGKWNFVWPFRWQVNPDHLRGLTVKDYVFCSPPNEDPNILSLGALLTEPFDPNSQIRGVYYDPVGGVSWQDLYVSREVSTGTTIGLSLGYSGIGAHAGFEYSFKTYRERFKADRLRTSEFKPGSLLSESHVMSRPHDRSLLTSGKQALYMVTGIQVAKGLTISAPSSEPQSLIFPILNSRSGTSDLFHSESEVLLAYRLHIVRRSRHKGAFILGSIYRPEEDW